MAAFLIRRLLGAIVLLFITSMVTFAIFFIVPRIAGQSVDQLAAQYVGKDPSQAEIEATKVKLGLDKPLVVQYGQFVKGIVAGRDFEFGPDKEYCPPPCFGYSFKTQRPVWPDLVDRIGVTASLAAGASILWLIAGVAIGVLSALRKGTFFDRAAMLVALGGVSLPIFFTGLLSLALFRPSGVNYVPLTENPLEWADNLLLPWVTLAFLYAALYARLTRAGMLETMGEDFIRTARAKGLTEPIVVTRHALRATLTPILTVFGLDIGLLLGGAVLTESTYSLPGIGRYAIDAINNNDLPQVLGVTMLAALFIVLANLTVDILYAVADPRVRL
ncbi:ABC transporter permease [Longispora fulva]|uniref:Peptide/nickel transport system permease protein n=1 Tax=Longispora fulva TaxID=619741 RepID=A0A8J7G7E8_9ACTN|nr:ABC transporter permease [Longispora fulva]MBG6135078.1 peptide/nickel transport system permease protein [Longispora fulva]GIG56687.1 ABC transporter permease [Longispora fulva]